MFRVTVYGVPSMGTSVPIFVLMKHMAVAYWKYRYKYIYNIYMLYNIGRERERET